MEQYVRDARIAQIYEGTNGVHAMDLVGRKLTLGGGRVVEDCFELMSSELDDVANLTKTTSIVNQTRTALELLRKATADLRGANGNAVGAAAVDYLRLFALVAMGWMWARIAGAAAKGDTPLHEAKLAVAEFFAVKMLPQSYALAENIAGGAVPLMALANDDF